MQQQLNVQQQSISGAFQDLNKLMQQVEIIIGNSLFKPMIFIILGERYGEYFENDKQ